MSEDILPLVKVVQKPILPPDQISIDKILILATKDDLLDFLSLDQFRGIERVVKENNGGKFKIKSLKEFIKNNPELYQQFSRSKTANVIYKRYIDKLTKMNSEEGQIKQLRQKQAASIMNKAKRKYVGCLATKIDPEIYEDCLYDYNDPAAKYEQYGIIPYNALKQQQYSYELQQNHPQRAAALKLPENAKISYLPKGIRKFIDTHPEDFNDYLQEIKAEGKYLEAIKKAMRRERDSNQRELTRKRLMNALEREEEEEVEY